MHSRPSPLVLTALALLAAGCFLAAPAPTAVAQNPTALLAEEENVVQIYQSVSPAVVSLRHRRGSGSGVIIRADGIVLTNAHVVANATTVQVDLADGRSLQGAVLGSDPTIDIAVVRIPAEDLPAATLGDSDVLEPGQGAIAIGNPFGLERTITTGIISAVNRSPRGFPLEGLIQTDAAINPGNSGGPLLDSRGRVIGINTAVLRPQEGGGAEGLGFAVPINLADHAAQQILTLGRVVRAFIGISYMDLEPEVAAQFELPVSRGVIIGDVAPDSPASRAGLRRGDIIVAMDGIAIQRGADLRRVLRERAPGTRVTVERIRDGEREQLQLELTEAPGA
jgi:serine protease Do